MNQNRGKNPNLNPRVDVGFEQDDDEMSSVDEGYYDELPRRRGRTCVEEDRRHWEIGMDKDPRISWYSLRGIFRLVSHGGGDIRI